MKETIKFYIISHKTGVRANQIEKFDFDKHQQLTFGRAVTNDVKFDVDQDIMVSREHARIVKDSDDPVAFTIVDNNSKNGVWVNGKRISGTSKINPGDTIELGQGGPTFVFDLDPRPKSAMAETRVMDVPKATQEIDTPKPPEKVGIGKQTFERAIAGEQKKSNKKLMAGLLAALMVIAAVAYVMNKKAETVKEDMTGQLSDVMANTAREDSLRKVAEELVEQNRPLKPEEIVALNENKVVKIEGAWELYDPTTGDQVWHQYVPIKQSDGSVRYVAAYILNSNGGIEPFLSGKSQIDRGTPIAAVGFGGSGFVVSASGFILTNRHVASGWHSVFALPEFAFPGVLLTQDGKMTERMVGPDDVRAWIPSETTMFGGAPLQQKLNGRNTKFNVVFAHTAARREAKVNLISDKHDAALIKVDFPGELPYVELLDNYNEIKSGQEVTVMGYPGVSPEIISIRRSSDGMKPSGELTTVPIPTVTSGLVGRLLKWSPENINLYSTFGDAYQLTINATGAGNSGGPMFDDRGRVIGIFYARNTDAQGTAVTFAVPIKYGLDLLGIDKVL